MTLADLAGLLSILPATYLRTIALLRSLSTLQLGLKLLPGKRRGRAGQHSLFFCLPIMTGTEFVADKTDHSKKYKQYFMIFIFFHYV